MGLAWILDSGWALPRYQLAVGIDDCVPFRTVTIRCLCALGLHHFPVLKLQGVGGGSTRSQFTSTDSLVSENLF